MSGAADGSHDRAKAVEPAAGSPAAPAEGTGAAKSYKAVPAGGGDVYFIVTDDDAETLSGVFFPDKGPGWWRARDLRGRQRRLWVDPKGPEPLREVLARLIAD